MTGNSAAPSRHEVLTRTLVKLKRMKAQLAEAEGRLREPIAIIGMACRFPGGADTPERFWNLLLDAKDAVGSIPADRWDLDAYYHADAERNGKMYTRFGAFLEHIQEMDAGFFGISPREAAAMDPQQRLLLEVSWEALESAAFPFHDLENSQTGVYVGITGNDYGQLQLQYNPDRLDVHFLTGNVSAFASGRLSYLLGLQGPSLAIDTSCSSSLVAIHTACAALRAGECDQALAGGVNVILLPDWNVVLSKARMMAPDGRCKTFDRAADGYVRGEGCGMLLLKKLSHAQRDGDRVQAVIRGSAVNSDGRAAGITVPNGAAQTRLLRTALERAGCEPGRVDYVEAHGTGTGLGDPIEVRSLASVFGGRGPGSPPLYLGSVKTNFGHLEPAAGVAGMIKTVLALQHETIPAHLHFRDPNPGLGLDDIPARIPTESVPWPGRDGEPRLAGVSSFGASGTNAHIILEEAPPAKPPPSTTDRSQHVLTLSARTPDALAAQAGRFAAFFKEHPDCGFADAAYGANRGRKRFDHRLAVTAAGHTDAVPALEAFAQGANHPSLKYGPAVSESIPKICFLFTGQGAQYAGMGRKLYREHPLFKSVMDRCEAILAPTLPEPLTKIMFAAGHESLLADPRYTQPALFALEYALAQLWISWGIVPNTVFGHSLGEFTAACVAGTFDLEEGLSLVAARARLMASLPGKGGMIAVLAKAETVAEILAEHGSSCEIAALNGPNNTVVSGFESDLAKLPHAFDSRNIRYKQLRVSHGFHSLQMDPILEAFEKRVAQCRLEPPKLPLINNLTGQSEQGGFICRPEYWRRQMREPVRFESAIRYALNEGCETFLEIGPASALTAMARRFAGGRGHWLSSLREGVDEWQTLCASLGSLYVLGATPDWQAFDAPYRRRPIPLPGYPFQRKRYWMDYPLSRSAGDTGARVRAGAQPTHPLLGKRLGSPLTTAQFETILAPENLDLLREFRIEGISVVNIGVYVEMALAAVEQVTGKNRGIVLDELGIFQALTLAPESRHIVQLHLEPRRRAARLTIQSQDPDAPLHWRRLVQADVRLDAPAGEGWEPFGAVSERCRGQRERSGSAFYENLALRNIHLGPSGRWIDRIWRTDREALCKMRHPRPEETRLPFSLQPGLLDAACQLLYALLPEAADPANIYMLVGWRHFELFSPESAPVWCHARLLEEGQGDDRGIGGNILLWSESGKPVAAIQGARIRKADPFRLRGDAARRGRDPSEDLKALLLAGAPVGAATGEPGRVALSTLAPARREALVGTLLLEHAAGVLGFLVSEIDTEQSLHELGLDSLLALELKSRMDEALGHPIPLVKFLEGQKLKVLAHSLAAEVAPATEPKTENPDLPELPWRNAPLPFVEPDPENALLPFGLTDMQQAYLVGRTENFELGNVPTFFTMEVDVYDLDLERLNQSWNQLIHRHAMLRAVFLADGRQKVLERVPTYYIQEIDLSGLNGTAREAVLNRVGKHLAEEVLDTACWPLFDIRVCRRDHRRVRVHFGMDALIVDAWSTMILFREWAAFYRDPGWNPPRLEIGFREYMHGLEQVRQTTVYQSSKAYWWKRLDELPPAPQLPTGTAPKSGKAPRFLNRPGRLEPHVWRRFKDKAKNARVTASMAVCTAYAEVLAAWSKSRHFTLDLLFFNRLPVHSQVKNVVANFSSTLLLEVDFRGQASFLDRAVALQTQLGRDLEHSLVSGVEVLRELNRRRGGTQTAVMPVVFASTLNLHSHETAEAPLNLVQQLISMGNGGEQVSSTLRTPQVWLDHQAMEDAGGFVFNWAGVDEVFPPGLLDEMFAVYHRLIERLGEDEKFWRRPLRLGMVPASQLTARTLANQTDFPLPDQPLHAGFFDTARRSPHRTAVVTGTHTITYGALAKTATLWADLLRAEGIRPNQLVAVVMNKHWQQTAATLAILKAGAAYLPISPEWPEPRIHHLLDHGRVGLALTLASDSAELGWPEGVRPVFMNQPPTGTHAGSKPGRSVRTGDLAYVIYTSGSTGLPKGVAIEHGAAANTLLDVNRRFAVGNRDIVFGITSLTFDLSVYDFFGTFAAGGTLVLPNHGDHHEPESWLTSIRRHRVTIWNSVPALMELLVEQANAQETRLPGSLRLILMSGDWIAVSLPGKIRQHLETAQIISLGGATEASVWSIFHPIETVPSDWSSIPYGRPLANQRFHVLDSLLEPCPVWVPGELYIGGKGLARAYWREAQNTEQAFITHPGTGKRIYRTGDLGRYLPDGTIEFLGRDDAQVKIQGYRVELGEIEAALNRSVSVRQGMVLALGERQGVKTLVAYVVPETAGAHVNDALRAELARVLPEYMIPAHIVTLAQMPLTPNGKVDRKALPKPGALEAPQKDFVKPETPVERELVTIWESLLEGNPIGVTDNFFELGGHSFLAMKLMARISARFKRQLPLSRLFSNGTVKKLAALLADREADLPWSPLVAIRPAGKRTPLFCVHPIGGNVLCYRDLALSLGRDRPVFGLQAPGLEGGVDALDRIEDLAELYLGSVREKAGDGPVVLGGWSLGGIVAYEMAVRLNRSGGTAPLVLLIDSFPPDGEPNRESDEGALWRGFLNDLGQTAGRPVEFETKGLGSLPEGARLDRVLAAIKRQHLVREDFEAEDLKRYWNVYRAHSRALAKYRPPSYEGDCLEVYAAPKPNGPTEGEPRSHWSDFCRGRTIVQLVQGDHYSLLRPPAVTVLAHLLEPVLALDGPSRTSTR